MSSQVPPAPIPLGTAGLAACVADGRIRREHRTVFLHTGGLPGLFGHPDLL